MRMPSGARAIPFEYGFALLGLLVVAGVLNPLFNDFMGVRADDYTESNPIRLVVTLSIYGVALVLATLRRRRTETLLAHNLLVMAVIALPLLSLTWSVDPATTLRRSVAHGLAGAFCVYIASTFSIEDLFRRLTLTFFIGAVLSCLYVVAVPDLAVHVWGGLTGSWRGVYGHKTELGQAASLGIIISLFAPDRTRRDAWLRIAALALSLFLLIMSHSVTHGLIVGALLVIIPIGCFLQNRRISAGLRISALVIFGVLAAWLASLGAGLALDAVGRDMSFSGRTTLWRGVSDIIAYKFPVLGAGYGAFFTPSGAIDDLAPYLTHWGGVPNHAHSGYLDTRANLGLPGVLLLGALIFVSLYRVIGKLVWGRVERIWIGVFAVQFLFLASNISGSSAFRHTDMAWMLFLILTCYAAPARASVRSPAMSQPKTLAARPPEGRLA